MIEYDNPLYRPPSEANSLILQITLGCSWNKCAFCDMYKTRHFKTIKEDDIIRQINSISKIYPVVRKVFLADGNPLVLSSKKLLNILTAITGNFPNLQRISAYSLPADINRKTLNELIALREAGLKLIYVGIESGDDEVLKFITKGETYSSNVEGLLKAKEAGIKSSVIIINGLAGMKYTRQHAINSAMILNKVQPDFASVLVLSFPFGIDTYKKRFNGDYMPMTIKELLKEMELFIENTALESTIFRSDHASNYLVLKGVLSRNKESFLNNIRYAINNPQLAGLREEWQRGL